MDALTVVGVEVWVKVGCTEEERAFPQRLEIDVRAELDLGPAGRNDDLGLTVDYAAMAQGLRDHLAAKTYRLAEAVAETAADWTLWRFKPAAVTVRVRKRALPGIAHAEVEIRRPQSGR